MPVGLLQLTSKKEKETRRRRRISCGGAKLLTNKHRGRIGEKKRRGRRRLHPSSGLQGQSRMRETHVENKGIAEISKSTQVSRDNDHIFCGDGHLGSANLAAQTDR